MAPNLGKGVMLKIIRQPNGYATQLVSFVAIYSATSARDPQREAVLGKALAAGALMKVKSVRRDQHELEDRLRRLLIEGIASRWSMRPSRIQTRSDPIPIQLAGNRERSRSSRRKTLRFDPSR